MSKANEAIMDFWFDDWRDEGAWTHTSETKFYGDYNPTSIPTPHEPIVVIDTYTPTEGLPPLHIVDGDTVYLSDAALDVPLVDVEGAYFGGAQNGWRDRTAYDDILDAILHPETEDKQHSYEIVKEIFAVTGLDPATVGSLLSHVWDYGFGALSNTPFGILCKEIAARGANGAYDELSKVDWAALLPEMESAYVVYTAYEHQSIPTSNYDAYY